MTDKQKIKLVLDMIQSFFESDDVTEEATDCRARGWLDAVYEVLCYEAE